VFVLENNAEAYWTGCLATVTDAFPELPVVGYERGSDLEIAKELGFEGIGPLRVWTY